MVPMLAKNRLVATFWWWTLYPLLCLTFGIKLLQNRTLGPECRLLRTFVVPKATELLQEVDDGSNLCIRLSTILVVLPRFGIIKSWNLCCLRCLVYRLNERGLLTKMVYEVFRLGTMLE